VIKPDILENQAKFVYLGIGSNLGNRIRNIEITKFKLQLNNIKILKSSSYYESLSWPDPKKPKFINIVIKIKTDLSPLNLLKICNIIENQLGRKRISKNSPRTCDIDIIDYDKITLTNKITLPHPSMSSRNFVLLPLYEINKTWKHPKTNANIQQLINTLSIKDLRSITQI
jgi:2-amino-4-hydroxy-6-hydroxymethyldihydropteridine diphosphokinase